MESKLTIQFEGDIKPLRIVDNEEEKLHDFFQKISKKTPGALYQTKLHDIDEATFIPGNRDTLEERAVLFKQYHQNLEDWPCHWLISHIMSYIYKKRLSIERKKISILQPFLKFKKMETKLFDFRKGWNWLQKTILQAVLLECEDKNLESYPTRKFKIATDISSIGENRKTRFHICSFHFLKMNRESIQKLFGKKDDAGKNHFCTRIIGRLTCCQSSRRSNRNM